MSLAVKSKLTLSSAPSASSASSAGPSYYRLFLGWSLPYLSPAQSLNPGAHTDSYHSWKHAAVVARQVLGRYRAECDDGCVDWLCALLTMSVFAFVSGVKGIIAAVNGRGLHYHTPAVCSRLGEDLCWGTAETYRGLVRGDGAGVPIQGWVNGWTMRRKPTTTLRSSFLAQISKLLADLNQLNRIQGSAGFLVETVPQHFPTPDGSGSYDSMVLADPGVVADKECVRSALNESYASWQVCALCVVSFFSGGERLSPAPMVVALAGGNRARRRRELGLHCLAAVRAQGCSPRHPHSAARLYALAVWAGDV